jgi:hypothetical protein
MDNIFVQTCCWGMVFCISVGIGFFIYCVRTAKNVSNSEI